MKRIVFVFAFIACSVSLGAQTYGTIGGKVSAEVTGNPLIGITVKVLGTKLGAKTNTDGSFLIKNIPAGSYSIQFSGVGYSTFVQTNVAVNAVRPVELEVTLAEKVVRAKEAQVYGSYFIRRSETVTSTQSLNADDIRRAPGVQEDVVRAASLLPGVGVAQPGRNDLVVRGGAPFENLYIVDNLEIPNINHFGTQGTGGGPLSLINIDFVNNVSFSAGGFGARYGDRTSSIMNISLRNGNSEHFTGKAVLSAIGFGANAEGPLSKDITFLASVRRSYLDFIFKAAGFAFIPQYWDFQTKFNYTIDKSNTISFLTIGALNTVTLNNDELDNRYKNSSVAIPNQNQYFSGITWRHLFGSGYSLVTLGETMKTFDTYQKDSNLVEIFRNKSKEAESSLKTDVEFLLAPNIEFMAGNQLRWATTLQYDVLIPGFLRTDAQGTPRELRKDTTFSGVKNSTYASFTMGLGDFKFTLGGRMDYFNFTDGNLFLSPRFSAVYVLNPVSSFIFSAGRYYQAPSYVWLAGGSESKLKPIKADQVVLGYEHTPMEDVKVQIEGFYKWYADYPARQYRPQAVLAPSGFDDLTYDIPYGLEPLESSGSGFSRGVELFIQKKYSSNFPIYGLLTVTLSEVRFTSIDGVERVGSFDQRFILNLALGWRPTELWEFSCKFRLSTGLPTTPFTDSGRLDFTRYNEGERLPAYHSLDVRADKRWNFDDFALVTYIDIQNVYGNKYKSAPKWDQRTSSAKQSESIGFLPSIGISFEF